MPSSFMGQRGIAPAIIAAIVGAVIVVGWAWTMVIPAFIGGETFDLAKMDISEFTEVTFEGQKSYVWQSKQWIGFNEKDDWKDNFLEINYGDKPRFKVYLINREVELAGKKYSVYEISDLVSTPGTTSRINIELMSEGEFDNHFNRVMQYYSALSRLPMTAEIQESLTKLNDRTYSTLPSGISIFFGKAAAYNWAEYGPAVDAAAHFTLVLEPNAFNSLKLLSGKSGADGQVLLRSALSNSGFAENPNIKYTQTVRLRFFPVEYDESKIKIEFYNNISGNCSGSKLELFPNTSSQVDSVLRGLIQDRWTKDMFPESSGNGTYTELQLLGGYCYNITYTSGRGGPITKNLSLEAKVITGEIPSGNILNFSPAGFCDPAHPSKYLKVPLGSVFTKLQTAGHTGPADTLLACNFVFYEGSEQLDFYYKGETAYVATCPGHNIILKGTIVKEDDLVIKISDTRDSDFVDLSAGATKGGEC